jgi:hypothetical protein
MDCDTRASQCVNAARRTVSPYRGDSKTLRRKPREFNVDLVVFRVRSSTSEGETMRHATRIARLSAVVTPLVLALGLTAVAFGGVARRDVATKVTVTFTDAKFVLSPAGLQAGTAKFLVVNKGHTPHALAIAGPGLKSARTPKLAAGATATLTIVLRTGAYALSDAVGAAKGHWLVVGPATVVSSRGNGSVSTTPGFIEPGMACD